jgi:tetratricopeptide (TPR) repeat protein
MWNFTLRVFVAGLLLCMAPAMGFAAPVVVETKPVKKPVTSAVAKPSVAKPSVAKTFAKPIDLGSTQKVVLDLTDDIPTAEAQAKAHPTDPEAQFLLAIAYSRSPYVEKALAVLQKTKRLIKDRNDRLATADKLINEYESALVLRPTDTRILYRLAFGYYLKAMGLKKYQQASQADQLVWVHKAQQTFTQLLSLDANDTAARNYYGFILAEEGTDTQQPLLVEKAIGQWQQSIQLNPINPGAFWLLGTAYLKQGNVLKAAQYMEKGVEARQQPMTQSGTQSGTQPVVTPSTTSTTPVPDPTPSARL